MDIMVKNALARLEVKSGFMELHTMNSFQYPDGRKMTPGSVTLDNTQMPPLIKKRKFLDTSQMPACATWLRQCEWVRRWQMELAVHVS